MSLEKGLKIALVGMGVMPLSFNASNLRELETRNLIARRDGVDVKSQIPYFEPSNNAYEFYNEHLAESKNPARLYKLTIDSIAEEKLVAKPKKSKDMSFLYQKPREYNKSLSKKFYKVSGNRMQKFR